MDKRNRVLIDGTVIKRSDLRYTPAGMPVLELVITHLSEQIEAGRHRKVECEVAMMALGDIAAKLDPVQIGQRLASKGFIAAKSNRYRNELVLHLEEFELLN
ncbi:primosomal replication protein N [Iodobacter ciconiae]|uniref:primosomal replication protein N n=1 Tax=Iodobacter ciconiae TaxID=2496266 RepID=UPI0013DECA2D|nr:primosomal replication protein N [Iodobacter ciconiae]